MTLDLPYGRRAYTVDLGGRDATVLDAPALAEPRPVEQLLDAALDRPTGHPLEARAGDRVTLVVSDSTRTEPRRELVEAIRQRLPARVELTLAVATGTHGPCDLEALGLPARLRRGLAIVNHDGHLPATGPRSPFVELGTTTRGTPVRVHRCLVEADLVIATGCIRPHYFAGFGAGGKALFPGLGEATAIRINHRLKTDPSARAGVLDGNPCREDLDEAVRLLPTRTFLLDGVVGPGDRIHAAVAGDLHAAFRAGAAIARPWFTVRARPAAIVIASDALPVSATLYQAAKIAAAAAPLVAPGGTLILAAQCPDGTGPLDVVNEAIVRTGVLPRLPPDARVFLVSDLGEERTRQTPLGYAASVEALLAELPGDVLVLPRASHLIAEPRS